MIIRQNDSVILKGETNARKVIYVEPHYTGDYYLFEDFKTLHTLNIVDIEKTIQHQRNSNINTLLDGCHTL
jgi:hypothetical protein